MMKKKMYKILLNFNIKVYGSYNKKSDDQLSINDYVIVDTDYGIQLGKIVGILNINSKFELIEILRKAKEEEYDDYVSNLKDAEIAHKKAIELANDLNLSMNIINASYSLNKDKLLFNFTADERIDFRELAKKLASLYHTRIELRQIGARDRAKEIGGYGLCGQRLCCASHLNKMDVISMNMAKNQNLALNPNKINGLCGRLLCCLQYEDKNYIECSKDMPTVGKKIKTPDGEGIVESIDILKRTYKATINGIKKEYSVDENSKK